MIQPIKKGWKSFGERICMANRLVELECAQVPLTFLDHLDIVPMGFAGGSVGEVS